MPNLRRLGANTRGGGSGAAAQPAKLLAAAYQGTQAGRVQETGAAQVRDNVNGAEIDQVDHLVAELRGGVGIDVAFDPQHGAVTACCNKLRVKGVHTASFAGLVVPATLASRIPSVARRRAGPASNAWLSARRDQSPR
jgi:hypothetical protein